MELVHSTETSEADLAAEAAAHAVLRLVGDFPGCFGRLRAARILAGRPVSVPASDIGDAGAQQLQEHTFDAYALESAWRLSDLCDLIDALLAGDLLRRTPGMRPTLVLTRPGHHALDALEQGSTGTIEWE